MRRFALLMLLALFSVVISAQTQSTPPAQSVPADNSALFSDLDRLQAAASQANTDIEHMHIDKWKADNDTKQQSQANASSLQRNLTSALPGLISNVRTAPQDLTASFKLYRNLSALYDVMASFTEAAGAFGPKGDYDALAQKLNTIDSTRRDLGDRLEGQTVQTEAELTQLRAQVRTLQQAAVVPAAPPKKVVVDNSDTGKKATHTKRKPATDASSQGNSSGSTAAPASTTKSQ
jgi:hypothetical protein